MKNIIQEANSKIIKNFTNSTNNIFSNGMIKNFSFEIKLFKDIQNKSDKIISENKNIKRNFSRLIRSSLILNGQILVINTKFGSFRSKGNLFKFNKCNFNTKFDKNHYLNFERNNIIRTHASDNEDIKKKTKIKNLNYEVLNNSGKLNLASNQRKFYFVFASLNFPLLLASIGFGMFDFQFVDFNSLARVLLNSQLLNNLFLTGILISALYKSTLTELINNGDFIKIIDSNTSQDDKIKLNYLKSRFFLRLLCCGFPGILNFCLTHALMNKYSLTTYYIGLSASGITVSYLGLLALVKIFKLNKKFSFFNNWDTIILANILMILLYFALIYKKFKGKGNYIETNITDSALAETNKANRESMGDIQPFKVKNDAFRLENLKAFGEIIKEDENKFSEDSKDIFYSLYEEIDNMKDSVKQDEMLKKLEEIFEEN